MSTVHNQSSNTTLSMNQIMEKANEALGKLTQLGVEEGQLTEGLTDAQTKVATSYEGYIKDYNSQANAFTKVSIGAAVATAVTGAVAGVGAGAVEIANPSSTAIPSLANDGMQVASVAVEGGMNVGKGVAGLNEGKSQAKEELSSAAVQLTSSSSTDTSQAVGNVMDTVNNGKSSIRSMIANEGQSSVYHG